MLDGNRISFPHRRAWWRILGPAAILAGLYALSQYDFLLFHCLTEAFSIVIAVAVFVILWNTYHYLENGFFLVIGLGCLFAGILDILYILAYRGTGIVTFAGVDGNVAFQAKTVAQWFVSVSSLCAFLFLRRKINRHVTLVVYSALLALALAAILVWHVFPDCLGADGHATRFERIGLIHSEVSEAYEALRKHGGDDYEVDGKPEGLLSELADIIIRTVELAEIFGYDLDEMVSTKMAYNTRRRDVPAKDGGKSI